MGSKSIIKDILIVVIGVIIIWVGLQIVFGTQNPFYVVSSGSMVPELMIYDVIVVQGNDPFEEVKIGDVIVFDRPSDHDRVIVHRVVAITDDDPFTVRTQGDANLDSIPGTDFPITAQEYIGTVAYVIPQVGFVTRIFATQIGGIPLNYIIIAIIVAAMIAKQFLKTKQVKIDNTEGTVEFGDIDVPKDSEYFRETKLDIPKDSEYFRETKLDDKTKDESQSEDKA